jgi:hypothetical protein
MVQLLGQVASTGNNHGALKKRWAEENRPLVDRFSDQGLLCVRQQGERVWLVYAQKVYNLSRDVTIRHVSFAPHMSFLWVAVCGIGRSDPPRVGNAKIQDAANIQGAERARLRQSHGATDDEHRLWVGPLLAPAALPDLDIRLRSWRPGRPPPRRKVVSRALRRAFEQLI